MDIFRSYNVHEWIRRRPRIHKARDVCLRNYATDVSLLSLWTPRRPDASTASQQQPKSRVRILISLPSDIRYSPAVGRFINVTFVQRFCSLPGSSLLRSYQHYLLQCQDTWHNLCAERGWLTAVYKVRILSYWTKLFEARGDSMTRH